MVWHVLESDIYLRPGAYKRKYSIRIYLGIFIAFSSICKLISKLLSNEFFVILFLILLPIKPPVASAVF